MSIPIKKLSHSYSAQTSTSQPNNSSWWTLPRQEAFSILKTLWLSLFLFPPLPCVQCPVGEGAVYTNYWRLKVLVRALHYPVTSLHAFWEKPTSNYNSRKQYVCSYHLTSLFILFICIHCALYQTCKKWQIARMPFAELFEPFLNKNTTKQIRYIFISSGVMIFVEILNFEEILQ